MRRVAWSRLLAALQPPGGTEIDARSVVEIFLVTLAAAHEQGDAIVGAGNDQRQGAALQARHAVAAQGVAEEQGLVARRVSGVGDLLEPGAHSRAAEVVQSLGEELDIHLVGRAGHRGAHLAVEHLAGDQFQAHGRPRTRAAARINSGFVPQQPPIKPAPASTRAGMEAANCSGLVR